MNREEAHIFDQGRQGWVVLFDQGALPQAGTNACMHATFTMKYGTIKYFSNLSMKYVIYLLMGKCVLFPWFVQS